MVLTSANQLTILRMVFAPIVTLLILYHHLGWALVVFAIAGATDALDGIVARRLDQRTAIGALLDPVADKLLLVSSFIVLSLPSLDLTTRIPLWLTVTALSRDVLIVTSCVAISLTTGHRSFPPSVLGKITTGLQFITVLASLIGSFQRIYFPFFSALAYATLSFTVISGLHYLYRGARMAGIKGG